MLIEKTEYDVIHWCYSLKDGFNLYTEFNGIKIQLIKSWENEIFRRGEYKSEFRYDIEYVLKNGASGKIQGVEAESLWKLAEQKNIYCEEYFLKELGIK